MAQRKSSYCVVVLVLILHDHAVCSLLDQPCTLADCKNPARHDQCRKPCGPGYRPGCSYCTSDPDKHQCSTRCKLPGPGPGPSNDPCEHWYNSNRGLIAAPTSRAVRDSWWQQVLQMRKDCQMRSNRSIYDVKELEWTATNYVQVNLSGNMFRSMTVFGALGPDLQCPWTC